MLFNTQADLGRCSSPIGIVIGQGFEIKSLIGKGAMGEVYHAIHPQFTSEDFAIKFLSEKIISSEMSRRFAREIKISASLGKKSPHIVKIKAYGLHNDSIPYYIMELLKGDTLANRMEESPLSLETFFNFTLQICSALKVAHEGIEIKGSLYPVIHRDLKPSNIFVSLDPSGQDTLKILDYGIAKLVGYKAKLTRTGHFLGTLGYCSPEQMQGEKVDHRADIYSLGVLMYRMITGDYPWEKKVTSNSSSFDTWYKIHSFEPPRAFNVTNYSLNIPSELETLILQCLAKNPNDRPGEIESVIHILESLYRQYFPSQPKPQKSKIHLSKQTHQSALPAKHSCKLAWPTDKPIAKIIFPKTVSTDSGKFLGLWTMLSDAEVRYLQNNTFDQSFNQGIDYYFLSCLNPYPLLLLSVTMTIQEGENQDNLENRRKWLNCFIDIKGNSSTTIHNLLLQQKSLKLIIFSVDHPQRPPQVIHCPIKDVDLNGLRDLFSQSQSIDSSGDINIAKNQLRLNLEKIKLTYTKSLENTKPLEKTIQQPPKISSQKQTISRKDPPDFQPFNIQLLNIIDHWVKKFFKRQ